MPRVLALLTLLVGLAAATAWCIERGESPPFLAAETARRVAVGESLGPGLHLAGSGSNLVVTRALAAAYRVAHPDVRIVVHDSIGSTGGVRAAADGVVALGLIARPLQPRERGLGLRVIPYARVAIAVLAHPDVRDEDVSSAELVASLTRDEPRWRDGTPLVWLLRERGDAGTTALARGVPGLAEAFEAASASRRFRVVYHDDELTRALLGLRGAIGIADLPQAWANAPTARVLRIDGRTPSVASVRDGSYPFTKDLAFVAREPISEDARRFVAFVQSAEGAATIERAGGMPLGEEVAP
ncbi:MAG: phosphate ABC transporter substrate-binding protein [Sandaracinaceae bacterium]